MLEVLDGGVLHLLPGLALLGRAVSHLSNGTWSECICTALHCTLLYCTDHVLVQGGLSAEGFAAVAAGELGQHHGPRLLLARVVLQGHVGVLTTVHKLRTFSLC